MDAFCSSCRKQLAPADVLYTADANVVCSACSDVAEVKRDEGRAALNINAAAWSCFAMSTVAWVFDPLFLLDVSALVSGIYAVRSMSPSNRQFTNYLSSGQRSAIWIASIIGLVVTGIHILIVATAMYAMSTARSGYGY